MCTYTVQSFFTYIQMTILLSTLLMFADYLAVSLLPDLPGGETSCVVADPSAAPKPARYEAGSTRYAKLYTLGIFWHFSSTLHSFFRHHSHGFKQPSSAVQQSTY